MGNVSGTYFIGNGSLLTGIAGGAGNYSNANVAAYLLTNSGNVGAGNVNVTGAISATGNVRGGNLVTAGSISATGQINATGTIGGGNVTTNGVIIATGNISTSANLIANGNIAVLSAVKRTIFVSNAAPTSGQGSVGDIWYQTY